MLSLVNGGMDPASVIVAVTTNDFTQLKPIPDLTSVQLQPLPDPDAAEPAAVAPPAPTLKPVAPDDETPADNTKAKS